jgi:hypothetical protein
MHALFLAGLKTWTKQNDKTTQGKNKVLAAIIFIISQDFFRKRFATMGEPWKFCKPKLEDDIVNGFVKDHWAPERVHSFRDIYSVVNFDRFKANLGNLREKLSTELDRAVQDDEAFHQDEFLALCRLGNSSSTSRKPRWDGSAAQRLLKEDMDDAANANMKPAALRAKRNEYECFDKKTFLKHVHQEKSSRKASPYWSKRREDKNKNKKNRKEISAKKNDECDAFLQSLQEE